MSFKQEDIEKFEHDWHNAERYLGYMLESKIISDQMYRNMCARIISIESLVLDISDNARSDKD